jgi:hypothetical protein
MGAGPVIITDDGGPPIIIGDAAKRRHEHHREGAEARHVKVGRQGEDMDELTKPGGVHTVFNTRGISRVSVIVDDQEAGHYDNSTTVDIVSNQNTDVTVVAAGAVTITTTTGLASESITGFGKRYGEPDGYISQVTIDKQIVYTGDGSRRARVEIMVR